MHSYYLPPVASTPWRPTWSPDGKWLAFSMAGSIWRINVEGDTANELTAGSTYDSSPSWSPDGRSIVYTADDGYRSINLMLLDVETGRSRPLTAGDGVNTDPVWTPDGKHVVYVSSLPSGSFNIFMLSPFDPEKRTIPLTQDHKAEVTRLYFGQFDLHIQPSISPDGKEMLFVSNQGVDLGSGSIWRAPIQPNAMRTAREILREETLYRTRPQWSPDGSRLVYSSHRGSQYNNLYLLSSTGGEPYQLTFGSHDHLEPRWSPNGEWLVYVSNENGKSCLRRLRVLDGEDREVAIRHRVHRRPMGAIEVTIRDAGTRSETAARVQLKASDGKAYAPFGAYQRVASRSQQLDYFHTDGHFTVAVPPGRATLAVVKGFEVLPEHRVVAVEPDKRTSLIITLKRNSNYKEAGWYSGTDHTHLNYGGNLHNTPENLIFMADAEDLDVVAAKIANKDLRLFDHQYFGGAYDIARSTIKRILSWGQEYRPPFYGHINLINLTEHLILPFTVGYRNTALASPFPSSTDILLAAKKQGALGGYVHPYRLEPSNVDYALARAFPIDLALGTIDYMEVLTSAAHAKYTVPVWYRALRCGFKVPPSAGADSITDLHRASILGAARMYAYVGKELSWKGWITAISKGRTMVTNGPLLRLEVDGKMSGDEIRLGEDGGPVTIEARLDSVFPVDRLELIYNGKVVRQFPGVSGLLRFHAEQRHAIHESGWFTLRATSSGPVALVDDTNLYAETAPIYVRCGEKKTRSKQDARYFLTWIDTISLQSRAKSGWRSESEKSHVLTQFIRARRIWEERATIATGQ